MLLYCSLKLMSRSRIKKYIVNPIYSWVCLPFESFPVMYACLKKADTFLKFSYIRRSFVIVKSDYTNSYLRGECFSHVLFSPYAAVLPALYSLCTISRIFCTSDGLNGFEPGIVAFQ
jgi:hypothetical protein